MKGSDLLFSAFKDVTARADCCAGAKAEADAARREATAANFIMVDHKSMKKQMNETDACCWPSSFKAT